MRKPLQRRRMQERRPTGIKIEATNDADRARDAAAAVASAADPEKRGAAVPTQAIAPNGARAPAAPIVARVRVAPAALAAPAVAKGVSADSTPPENIAVGPGRGSAQAVADRVNAARVTLAPARAPAAQVVTRVRRAAW